MADTSRLPTPVAEVWEWQRHGNCRNLDSSVFFHPDGERGFARADRVARAKEISAAMAAPSSWQNSRGRLAASICSSTTWSTRPKLQRSGTPIFCCRAICAACSVVRWMIALAPSGGSGESQEFSAASVRSAGSKASAAPPVPWPSRTETEGERSPINSLRESAISPAKPPSSDCTESSAPVVSMMVTSGSLSSWASCIPRRASRKDAGPRMAVSGCRGRCWPSTTHG